MTSAINLQNLATAVRASAATQAPAASRPVASGTSGSGSVPLQQARRELARMIAALGEIDRLLGGGRRLTYDLPATRSAAPLALDLGSTAANVTSSERLNNLPNSYAPFGPEWSGGSTAPITLGGDYYGTNGTGNLTFRVTLPGVRNVDRIRIEVRDPADNFIRNITVQPTTPLEQQYILLNGISLTLGAGSLVNGDTATAQVAANVQPTVDPDKPFNGVRNDNANLQYGYPAVIDGSFTLNGTAIAVYATDTLNDVIGRINAAGTGVGASFDVASQTIVFAQETSGAAPDIVLADDTSNFLTTAKLDTAVVAAGTDPEPERALSDAPSLAGVRIGSLLVNGEAVDVDPEADSLEQVITRINAADAGVVAGFDAATQKVSIAAAGGRTSLVLDDNGTDFLATLGIADGRVSPVVRESTMSARRVQRITDAAADLVGAMNALFSDRALLNNADPAVRQLRQDVKAAVSAALGAAGGGTGLGLGFRDVGGAQLDGTFAEIDRRRFSRSLRERDDSVRQFFNGSGSGFTRTLGNALQGMARRLGVDLEARGNLLDVRA